LVKSEMRGARHTKRLVKSVRSIYNSDLTNFLLRHFKYY